MSNFKIGDFIRITKDDTTMAKWAMVMAQEEAIFEVLELRSLSYWCKHKSGGEYGIAYEHAIPVKTDLISQIKQESKHF